MIPFKCLFLGSDVVYTFVFCSYDVATGLYIMLLNYRQFLLLGFGYFTAAIFYNDKKALKKKTGGREDRRAKNRCGENRG